MTKKASAEKQSKVFLRILKDTRPIAPWLTLTSFISMLSVFFSLVTPLLVGNLLDEVYLLWVNGAAIPNLESKLIRLALIFLGAGICSLGTMLVMNNVVSRFFTCTMRIKISDKILRLPVKYVDDTPNGEVISRMTDDVSVIGNTIHSVFNLAITGIAQVIGIAVMMFTVNYVMALIVLSIVPVSVFLSAYISGKSQKHFVGARELGGKHYSVIEENCAGFDTVKAFSMEEIQRKKHESLTEKLKDYSEKGYYLAGIVEPVISFTNNVAYILICLIGGLFAVTDKLSVGGVIAVILYSRLLANPLSSIAGSFGNFQHTFSGAKRVYEILDTEEMPPDRTEAPPKGIGNVEFKNVYFSYKADEPLIENLNLTVKAGQKVAIVGPTGGGKTTLVNLLMRFYDIKSGQILIDGVDITSTPKEALREIFGMVLQETWLFSGSVYDNIAYGAENATKEEVMEAAENARIDYFINSLEKGYDTVINEESANISGGQKQMLTIARAYLKNPKILILDEATSSVDTRTELLIQETMDKLMQGKTSFVIAHRLSTIVDADIILVVRSGSIVESGTHKELMEKNGFYVELYNSQYSGVRA